MLTSPVDRCTFRVATKFHNGKLKVETICAEHSPACMTNYGNAPPDVKPKISTKSTSLAARKTGSTASRRKLLESVDKRSSHTKSVDEHQYASTELPDLFPKPPFAETRDAQFGRAAQEREHVVASIPTTSRKGKNRQRGGASTPSTSRSKHTKAPPKPQEGRIYNSMHHFLNDVKAYSEAKSPAADLRRSDNHGSKGKGKTKAAKTLIMECGYPGCPFRIAGKSLQDAKGRDLEGFQVLSVGVTSTLQASHPDAYCIVCPETQQRVSSYRAHSEANR